MKTTRTASRHRHPRRPLFLVLILLLLLDATSARAEDESSIKEAFQQALFEEEANRDLDAAIEGYEVVIDQFQKQRKLAATALFRLAECYRKRDDEANAIAQYLRLLEAFPEEETLAKLSRENLKALGASPPALGTMPLVGADGDYEILPDERDEIDAIKRLIANSPDLINAVRKDHLYTPIEFAARNGYVAMALFLIENGADIDLSRERKFPPLHLAASYGHLGVVKLLLDHGADIDLEALGRTALQCAVVKNRDAVARELIARGADLSPTVYLFVESGGGAFLDKYFAEDEAWSSPRVTISREDGLISYGSSRDSRRARGNVLHLALLNDRADLANLLLDEGSSATEPAQYGITPLHLAIRGRHLEIAKRLIEAGADVQAVTEQGETILGFACRTGQVDFFRLIRDHGADVNQPSFEGETPLIIAISRGTRDLVEAILDDGANTETPRDSGITPLGLAVSHAGSHGTTQTMEALLDHGAEVDGKFGEMKITPFMAAFPIRSRDSADYSKAKLAAAQLLLDRGANVNARNRSGATALFSQRESGPGMDFLIDAGVDPRIKNDDGLMAIDHIRSEGVLPVDLFRLTRYVKRPGRKNHFWLSYAYLEPAREDQTDRILPIFDADMPGAESVRLADLLAAAFPPNTANDEMPKVGGIRLFRGESLKPVLELLFYENPVDFDERANVPLKPGDIVEIEWGQLVSKPWWQNGLFEKLRNQLDEHVTKTVRLRPSIDDGERIFTVVPPRTVDWIYDPARDRVEALTVKDFLTVTGRMGPDLDLTRIRLTRADQSIEPITLDLTDPDGDALLMAGDTIDLVSHDLAENATNKRLQAIWVSRPEDGATFPVFKRHDDLGNQFDLSDLLATAYYNRPFLLPRPDLEKVRIRRIDEAGVETVETIKLSKVIRAIDKAESGIEVAADAGVAAAPTQLPDLAWGDIVELPAKAADDSIPWAGLDQKVRSVVYEQSTINYSINLYGGKRDYPRIKPQFADYEFVGGQWKRSVKDDVEFTSFAYLRKNQFRDRIAPVFKLSRRNPKHEIIFGDKDSPSTDHLWIRDGDEFQFNPAVEPETTQPPTRVIQLPSPLRRRAVLPPPSK